MYVGSEEFSQLFLVRLFFSSLGSRVFILVGLLDRSLSAGDSGDHRSVNATERERVSVLPAWREARRVLLSVSGLLSGVCGTGHGIPQRPRCCLLCCHLFPSYLPHTYLALVAWFICNYDHTSHLRRTYSTYCRYYLLLDACLRTSRSEPAST